MANSKPLPPATATRAHDAPLHHGRGAFLCADLELTPEVRDDHSAYIASWLKVLKHDKRAIFSAAAHAQRAVDHLNSLQAVPQAEAAE